MHTLLLVLSDTAAEVVVCDIGSDWLTSRAAARSDEFLRQVRSIARDRFRLATVAC